jgi:heme/copper-type cytochrome/quinol oxidase subunit 2
MAENPIQISDTVMITAIIVGGVVTVLFYVLMGFAFYYMAKSRHKRAYEEGRLAGAVEAYNKFNKESKPATDKFENVILG